jgi:hypothetical protein
MRLFAGVIKTARSSCSRRVEWYAPDFQNRVVHRGATLYVTI